MIKLKAAMYTLGIFLVACVITVVTALLNKWTNNIFSSVVIVILLCWFWYDWYTDIEDNYIEITIQSDQGGQMRLSNFVEGLQILSKYYKDPTGYHIDAQHDEVHCYPTDLPLSEDDAKAMFELGWIQADTPSGEYCPEAGWMAYV